LFGLKPRSCMLCGDALGEVVGPASRGSPWPRLAELP
jgi:hypothetical protein